MGPAGVAVADGSLAGGVRGAAPALAQEPFLRLQGSGFRVQGSGFRVQGSGFRVQGSGFAAPALTQELFFRLHPMPGHE